MVVAIVLIAYGVVFIALSALFSLDREEDRVGRRRRIMFGTAALGTGATIGSTTLYVCDAGLLGVIVGGFCGLMITCGIVAGAMEAIERRDEVALAAARVAKIAGKVIAFPLWGPFKLFRAAWRGFMAKP